MKRHQLPVAFGRLRSVLLFLILALPLFAQPVGAAVSHVVLSWTSPTWGYTIDYRRDTFRASEETATGTFDEIDLLSNSSVLSIEAIPYAMSVDECALETLNDTISSASSAVVVEPVQNGSGVVAAPWPNNSGQIVDVTHRVDCIASSDGGYLLRFTHRVLTSQYGLLEAAARSVRESYRPGYPANTPLPPEMVYPDGLVEVSWKHIEREVAPPTDSNLVNHPTRFFVVEINFASVTNNDAIIEGGRLVIEGIGPALVWDWEFDNTVYDWSWIKLINGATATGRFLFAVPQTQSEVVFCYQHATDSDCAFLFEYSFNEPVVQTAPGEVEGGGPASRPRINPGR